MDARFSSPLSKIHPRHWCWCWPYVSRNPIMAAVYALAIWAMVFGFVFVVAVPVPSVVQNAQAEVSPWAR